MYESARLFEKSEQPDSAVFLYRKTIKALSDTGSLAIKSHIRLGSLLRKHHLYERALAEHRHALSAASEISDKRLMSHALRELGKDYLYIHEPDSAIAIATRTLSLAEAMRDSVEIMAAHNTLSVAYNETDSTDTAIAHAYTAINMSSDSAFIYANYLAIAQMHMKSHKYDSAHIYSLRCSHSPNICTRAASYRLLMEISRLDNDYAAYEKYSSILEKANDSIRANSRTETITDTEYSFQIEQILEGEKESYIKIILAITTISVASISLLTILNFKKRKKKHSDNEDARPDSVSAPDISLQREKLLGIIEAQGESYARHFIRTKAFKSIKDSISAKTDGVLTTAERSKAMDAISKAFDAYIADLKSQFGLTSDEALLSCLLKCGFSTKECAICKGVTQNAIRTQKSRIKAKII